MILPTKRIPEERALVRVGADVLKCLNQERTVSRLWTVVRERRSKRGSRDILTFEWFVLSLDMLFALGLVDFVDGRIRRSST